MPSNNTNPMGTAFARGGISRRLAVSALCMALIVPPALAAPAARAQQGSSTSLTPCSSISVAETARVTLGKSTLVKLPAPVARMVVGGMGAGAAGRPVEAAKTATTPTAAPAATTDMNRNGVAEADVMLLSPSELYVIGKRVGSMNLILQGRDNRCTVMDISVTMDSSSLQAKFTELMPGEKGIKVAAAEDSLILSGEVADSVKVDRALALAAAYAPEKRVVNLLRAAGAHQVMLEVKVAEVSKSILDQMGSRVELDSGGSGTRFSLFSDFLSNGSGMIQAFKLGKRLIQINGEVSDGVVRILAEPNIMAVSGQQASFLSGGKIFIPVAQTPATGIGFPTITLEEKEFGVGVKFTPTVLEGGRINLKVASEVSELSQTGSPFTTTGGVTAILPSFTTRRADTTVQLKDGQSFAIAGLIKNNLNESVQRFPGLGEIPILGALFRSSEFQKDMTELMFIITPRLVKPLPPTYALPTDALKEPGRTDAMVNGTLEGSSEAAPETQKPAPVSEADPATATTTATAAAASTAPAKTEKSEPTAQASGGNAPAPAPVQAAPKAASDKQAAQQQPTPGAPLYEEATAKAVPLSDAPRALPAADEQPPQATPQPTAQAGTPAVAPSMVAYVDAAIDAEAAQAAAGERR